MSLRRSALPWLLVAGGAAIVMANQPYGLDSRPTVSPYLNGVMPMTADGAQFPLLLSQTGAFSDLNKLTAAPILLPFTVNSPLWSDGAVKSRWMAVPDGRQIGFVAAGDWSFPNGTVFVKNFELVTNEVTGERKRLETRFLVRDANGEVYGVTYKWRADNSDADLLSASGLDENVNITTASGAVRVQKWSYPSRANCLFCHNAPANYVLGVKTHQLNGDLTYPSTGRTDNQLRTLGHIGLLNPAPAETDIPGLLKAVHIENTTAPVQHRMRSWIDSNCSDCHRPGGYGPGYDARFYTPLSQQKLINTYVKFRDIAGSLLYQRDNALDNTKMPPLAKNVVHEAAMANLRQWIASPFEVLSVYLAGDESHIAVRFNSHVDPATATSTSNYAIDKGVQVFAANAATQRDTVMLTVSPLIRGESYTLTINDVSDTAPSANTIWPDSTIVFAAVSAAEPAAKAIANVSARVLVMEGVLPIGGFIAKGTMPKRMMVRALARPGTLEPYKGETPALSVEVHDSTGALIGWNDGWQNNYDRQEISDTGIAPLSNTDAVILMRLPVTQSGNAYTVRVVAASGHGGGALLEGYDLDEGSGSQIVNASSRGLVVPGDDNAMIGGFIVTGSVAQQVLIRALGPSLPLAGAGQLTDPQLELHDGNGVLLQANDNWKSDQQAEVEATTIPPPNELESAIVRTVAPGSYTAIVRAGSSSGGTALLEIYALN